MQLHLTVVEIGVSISTSQVVSNKQIIFQQYEEDKKNHVFWPLKNDLTKYFSARICHSFSKLSKYFLVMMAFFCIVFMLILLKRTKMHKEQSNIIFCKRSTTNKILR